MDSHNLNRGLIDLEEEIGRLERVKLQFDAPATRSQLPAVVAERIGCSLQVAIASLERDAALLSSELAHQSTR